MQVCLAGNAQSATAPKVDFEVVFPESQEYGKYCDVCAHCAARVFRVFRESLGSCVDVFLESGL